MLKQNIVAIISITISLLISSGCSQKAGLDYNKTPAVNMTSTNELKTLQPIIYKTVDGIDLLCEIDLPDTAAPYPVVLYAHSWSGNLNQLKAFSQHMAQCGVAGVRINYRKLSEGTTFANAKQDIEDAVEFVRTNADQYGFDMNRFGMAGASAGAVLTSLISQQTPECKVYIAFNGGFDFLYRSGSGFLNDKVLTGMFGVVNEQRLREASAIYNLRDVPPDTLLFHGTGDTTISCEQAKRFAQAIIDKGGKARVELYEGREHGFFNPQKADYPDIRDKMERYLLSFFGHK